MIEKKYDIGLIGLAVMGQNLVLNMESKGYSVAVYNRTSTKTEEFASKRAQNKVIKPTYTLEDFIASLMRPRKIILLIKAGAPVDKIIDELIPFLDEGDIIIDGGNSYFRDTDRRYKRLTEKGFLYLGTGISGGEYGALNGPSIMPGGSKEAYKEVEEILKAIAAQTEDGPCVTYIGPGSSGHYVKMVHNGIEYAVMQVIAEVYDLMRKVLKMAPVEMSDFFKRCNQLQQSYLLEITHEILEKIDHETSEPLIDVILDAARQKGTGKWSVEEGLELGVPIPTITAGVNARMLSAMKEERREIGKSFESLDNKINSINDKEKNQLLNDLQDALYLSIVTAYAEGMKLLQIASEEYSYGLALDDIARIWEDGCIIRSTLLKPIQMAYKNNPELINLINSRQFKQEFTTKTDGWRKIISLASKLGIPVPAMSAALCYFESLKSVELPANIIQAQRDYFGAHTYERKDKPGLFHTEWQDIHNIT